MPCGIMCAFGLEMEEGEGGMQCDMSRNPSGPWEFGQLETEFSSVQFSRAVVSNSLRPHRRQPTRMPRPWDSPGKNTGVRCHFLLQCMKVKSESEVAQSCLTLSDPMDCSLPGSSIHGIFQARVLDSSFPQCTVRLATGH